MFSESLKGVVTQKFPGGFAPRPPQMHRSLKYLDPPLLFFQPSSCSMVPVHIPTPSTYGRTTLQIEGHRFFMMKCGGKIWILPLKLQECLDVSMLQHLETSGQTFQPFIRKMSVEVASNTKYLAVQIDEHLSWKEHIKLVTTKASCAIDFLRYAKKVPSYCSRGVAAISLTSYKLKKLQNRAAHVMTDSQFDAPSKTF